MKILIVYLEESEKLRNCLESLKKFSPEIPIILKKADKKKNIVAEEIYNEFLNSPEFDDDVMIWHPDMEATPSWYEKLKAFYNYFDVIGCKLLYPNKLIQHYGGMLRFDSTGIHPEQYCLNVGCTEPISRPYVTGPSMIIKKKVYEAVGGFDLQFTGYIDADYCMMARQKGFSVGVVPVELIHAEMGERNLRLTNQRMIESRQKFIAKWMNVLGELK